MSYAVRAVAVLGVLMVVAGCYHQDDNDLFEIPPSGVFRVTHAVADAPELIVTINGARLTSLDYGQTTALIESDPGDVSFDLTYVDPATGETTTLLSDVVVTISEDRVLSVVVRGSLAMPETLIVDTALNELDAGLQEIELRYVNATQNTVDIYLTDADELLANVAPSQTLASGGFSDSIVALASDNYRLRITAENDTDVLYDSGPFSIDATARIDFTVIESFGPRADALRATVASAIANFEFANLADLAAVRSLNSVADETSIDVSVSDQATSANITSDTLPFGALSAFTTTPAADVTGAYSVASDPLTEAVSTDFSMAPGGFYTFAAAGSSSSQSLIGVAIQSSDMRPAETIGRLHFVNAAESAGNVDVYYLDSGEVPDNGTPTLSTFGLLDHSQNAVLEGSVDVYVTAAGQKSVLVGPVPVAVASRDLLLLYLTDSPGGGAPIQLEVTPEAP
jgi:hypothetical protein